MSLNNISEHEVLEQEQVRISENISATKSFDLNVFSVDFSKALKKFWYIVVAFALICGCFTSLFTHKSYIPMYQSSVSFSVSAVSYNSSGVSVFASYYDNSSASQLSKTFPYIVNTSMMKNALKEELGTDWINGTITAEAVASESNIFKVSVNSNSPEDAYNIVNAVINVYPDVASFVVGNVKLNILIKPTLPENPYTTDNFIRAGILMSLIGACFSFALIGVYAFFRNTIRKKEDFKNILNQKCYVEIPFVVFHRKSSDKKQKDRIVRLTDKHPTFKESFRLLRKRLLRNLTSEEKIIGVTSPVVGEGKTTVALNLAHTLAIAGKKTACVDLDLKASSLCRYLSMKDKPGYCDLIKKEAKDFDSVAYKEDDNLYIFIAGNSVVEYNEESYSPFFDYLREKYDYVVVNISPGGDISDSVSVSNMCDCVLITVKQDSSSIDKIRKTLEYLSFSHARILGFVFNGVRDGFSGYGGYYYGGKYGYGKYGYSKYGYGKHGYGKYGYGYGHRGYAYGYGYGYGERDDQVDEHSQSKNMNHNKKNRDKNSYADIEKLSDTDIPDNNA